VLGLELEPIKTSVSAALLEGADGVAIRDLLQEWAARQNLAI
jgi:phosphotransferase system enzyme I (PtsP)